VPIDWAALGAFFSGVASVIAASMFVRRLRLRMEEDCQKRLEAFKEGMRMGRER
jgi:hypothetical protein